MNHGSAIAERLGGPGSVCILGGSFNPMHAGHVRVAVALHETASMERVDIIPAASPPHKPRLRLLPMAVRMAMAEAAAARLNRSAPAGLSPFRVSDLEARREGPSYSVDTLRHYRSAEPNARVFFSLGATDMVALDSWHEWRRLPELATFVITTRGETSVEDVLAFMASNPDVFPNAAAQTRRLAAGFGGEVPGGEPEYAHIRWHGGGTRGWAAFITMPRLDVSGTQIRALWRAERSLLGLVPECVEDVLAEREQDVAAVWGARSGTTLKIA
ncbi:MAG: nicotinate-nicotinamide nucleotide adenylyltransferase [Oceanidesulfovibrio sp.]